MILLHYKDIVTQKKKLKKNDGIQRKNVKRPKKRNLNENERKFETADFFVIIPFFISL